MYINEIGRMIIDDYVLLIIKGENKTSDVRSYEYNASTRKWDIVFNNGRKYSYSYDNVVVLKYSASDIINVNDIQIKHNGCKFNNISNIWIFRDKKALYEYWKIKFENGKESVYDRKALEVINNCLVDKKSNNVYSYLRDISKLFDFVKNNHGENVLEKRISNISYVGEDSALALYLNPDERKGLVKKAPEYYIFPFGCNNSQYNAIKKALNNKISIIQGPPGTGKTQTILNLITNIIIQEKTVLVVSSNNSAIENVFEKISDSKKDIGFIVASLGKADNKKAFIIDQSGNYPDFTNWNLKNEGVDRVRAKQVIHSNLFDLKIVFEIEEKIADLRNKKDQLYTEYQHFEAYIEDQIKDIRFLRFKDGISSKTWLKLWNELQNRLETGKKIGFFQKIRAYCKIKGDTFRLFDKGSLFVIKLFQYNYYTSAINELESQIKELTDSIKKKNILMNSLQGDSLDLVRYSLIDRYKGQTERPVFSEDDLWRRPEAFLSEYPVVLSTTFSSTTCLNKNVMYDYIIMDEASQVDVVTGALALSCAKNAIIVGDTMQLPNVVSENDRTKADSVFSRYNISEGYRYTQSFLQSVLDIIPDVEYTLLREHYRCHPKIINYCNQKFYNNELIIMTEDKGEKDVIVAYKTAEGNHSREKYSERQIDVIKNEVIPKYIEDNINTGIIAPYKNQVKVLQDKLPSFEVATVHKFQGREKDTIILSTVDDEVSDFVDNPNLLNVAISRAKKRLVLVVSGNEQKEDSNIKSLLDYIEYNNLEIIHSQIHSVFDYLYKQFNEERDVFFKSHKRVTEYDSENLIYNLLKDILGETRFDSYDIVIHYPLNALIKDTSSFSDREKEYAMNPLTHLDFLIYRKMNKQPVLAIEVDGYSFHKEDSKQGERDKLKNHILELIGIPLIRLKTNESNERNQIIQELERI